MNFARRSRRWRQCSAAWEVNDHLPQPLMADVQMMRGATWTSRARLIDDLLDLIAHRACGKLSLNPEIADGA